MIDSESKEVKSRRRQSCRVRDSSAGVDAHATLHSPVRASHPGRHYASDGFFALSKRIAERCVEQGVLRCHLVIAIFEAKSSPVAVCRREQDDRRSGRDVDDSDTIYKI